MFEIKLIFYGRMLQFSQFAWTLSYSVWDVFNNFLLIDTTGRSRISSDQKRFFYRIKPIPPFIFREHIKKTWWKEFRRSGDTVHPKNQEKHFCRLKTFPDTGLPTKYETSETTVKKFTVFTVNFYLSLTKHWEYYSRTIIAENSVFRSLSNDFRVLGCYT